MGSKIFPAPSGISLPQSEQDWPACALLHKQLNIRSLWTPWGSRRKPSLLSTSTSAASPECYTLLYTDYSVRTQFSHAFIWNTLLNLSLVMGKSHTISGIISFKGLPIDGNVRGSWTRYEKKKMKVLCKFQSASVVYSYRYMTPHGNFPGGSFFFYFFYSGKWHCHLVMTYVLILLREKSNPILVA